MWPGTMLSQQNLGLSSPIGLLWTPWSDPVELGHGSCSEFKGKGIGL